MKICGFENFIAKFEGHTTLTINNCCQKKWNRAKNRPIVFYFCQNKTYVKVVPP